MQKLFKEGGKVISACGATVLMVGIFALIAKNVPLLLEYAGTLTIAGLIVGITGGMIAGIGDMIWPQSVKDPL